MGNVENKKEFIKELFLYYKPTLSKEKQILLLEDWIDSCIQSEEYEMASVLKKELQEVIKNPEKPIDSTLKVVKIDELLKKSPKIPENDEKIPENPEKPVKKWKYLNIWDEPHGFIIIDLQLSFKRKYFKFVILNYGISYNI